MTEPASLSFEVVETAAKAIWAKRPDSAGKPWPIGDSEKDRRAYNHNPIAAADLCREYAKAALATVLRAAE